MTTAGPTTTASRPALTSWRPASAMAWLGSPSRWLSVTGLTAALIGSQTLAASSPLPSAVRLLLPSEGLLAGLGDGLRRGYTTAMDQSQACGITPPSLQLGWLPPGADPNPPLGSAPRTQLLVAPPAAPLAAYGRLADQQRLTVLLPLQRGSSLDGLPRLQGADRLWPMVPARSLEADRLAAGLLADGIRRVMVVRDPSADSRALSDRFIASFSNGRGTVIGPTGEPISIDGDDRVAIKQLIDDVDWYRPPALVVLTAPGSGLARRLQEATWPEGLLLAWPFRLQSPLPQAQLGVDPQSRGRAWSTFAARFQQRWGYAPGLVESAGYDTGVIAALASIPAGGRPGWDLQWFNATTRPLPLCEALQQRSQGARLRPEGATSRLDLTAGVSPGADLRLQRRAAAPIATP
ncbi:MAG: histidine kinase [Cyanobium sp.]